MPRQPYAVLRIRRLSTCALASAIALAVAACGSSRPQTTGAGAHIASTLPLRAPNGFSRTSCPPVYSFPGNVCYKRPVSFLLSPRTFSQLASAIGLSLNSKSIWCLPQSQPSTPRPRIENCHGAGVLDGARIAAAAISVVTMGPHGATTTTRPLPRRHTPVLFVLSRECPRNCVGLIERDVHAYDYEKQDSEQQDSVGGGPGARGV